MIPKNITREHVLRALKEIERNGVPMGRNSRKFVLSYEGKTFPPKYVVSLANKYANGIELDPSEFSGGKETNRFLITLRFEVLDKSTSERIGIGPEKILPEVIVSPLLESAREKLELAEEYIRKNREVLRGQIVRLSYEAVIDSLREKVIDLKGIKLIEQLRKNTKLYLGILVDILQKEGLSYNFKDLEKLKDLRNKVVHEDHRPSRKNALWAFSIARSFIAEMYPEVIEP